MLSIATELLSAAKSIALEIDGVVKLCGVCVHVMNQRIKR